jgi:hypothetical protein
VVPCCCPRPGRLRTDPSQAGCRRDPASHHGPVRCWYAVPAPAFPARARSLRRWTKARQQPTGVPPQETGLRNARARSRDVPGTRSGDQPVRKPGSGIARSGEEENPSEVYCGARGGAVEGPSTLVRPRCQRGLRCRCRLEASPRAVASSHRLPPLGKARLISSQTRLHGKAYPQWANPACLSGFAVRVRPRRPDRRAL